MGAIQSAAMTAADKEKHKLKTPKAPICATEARFVLPDPIELLVKANYWSFKGDDFKILHAETGQTYFTRHGKAFSIRKKAVLRDSAGVSIVNLKERNLLSVAQLVVFAGEHSEREVCTLKYKLSGSGAQIFATFNDTLHCTPTLLVLDVDWNEAGKAVVYHLQHGRDQGGVPIAKVTRPDKKANSPQFAAGDYIIQIATGVDVALIVIMLSALEENSWSKGNRRRSSLGGLH